jgi:hypothetical protein
MTEERKHAILFAATLLCARKLIETMESDKPNMAKPYWVDKAIDEAAFVLERIDKRWPEEDVSDGRP